MRRFVPLAVLAAAALLAGDARAQAPPNVLFVVVDDLNTALGVFGDEPGNVLQTVYPDPAVRAAVRQRLTPNLDALAASGVAFANAYATSPRCAPSRAALMTGIRPHVSSFDGEGWFRTNPVLADAPTLPEYLRSHGYLTAGVGKIFSNPKVEVDADGALVTDWPDTERSWDVWINREVETDAPVTYDLWSPPVGRWRFGTNDLPVEAQKGYQNAAVVADALRTGAGSLTDETYGTTQTLTVSGDQPFFLGVGLYRPHLPWIVPAELTALFPTEEMALTEDLREAFFADTDDLAPGGMALIFREGDEIVSGRAKRLYDHGASIDPVDGPVMAWKTAVQHYLAGVAQADRIMGSLLEALADGPFADNTVVVFWGDHGFHLGEKTWFGKTTLWEEATQAPLIIRAPEAAAPGVLRRQPVSLVDVFPTLVSLAGAPPLDGLGGTDLSPLLADPEAPATSLVLSQMGDDHHALRTETYRYIRYDNDRGNAELYCVADDPEERLNRIDDPAFADVRQNLETRLKVALATDGAPVATAPSPEASGARLLAPAPNPAGGRTAVRYRLAQRAEVTLTLVDALGRRVRTLDRGPREARLHRVDLDTGPLAAGVYILRLVAGDTVATERLLIVR
ncbi:MAG: sulfatase-like hydrolase/transferase [Bacteroidota bacterium]